MSRKFKITVLSLLVMAVPMFVASGIAPQNQPGPTPSGSGGSCSYCSSNACGCANAPLGCTLSFSCGCSSISCIQSCDYNCPQH